MKRRIIYALSYLALIIYFINIGYLLFNQIRQAEPPSYAKAITYYDGGVLYLYIKNNQKIKFVKVDGCILNEYTKINICKIYIYDCEGPRELYIEFRREIFKMNLRSRDRVERIILLFAKRQALS